jgi:hypothetical protein
VARGTPRPQGADQPAGAHPGVHGDLAQLVCWELLPDDPYPAWCTGDIERLDTVVTKHHTAAAEPQGSAARARRSQPTIVFAAYRATVHDLRRRWH